MAMPTGKDWPDNWLRFAALSLAAARHRATARCRGCGPTSSMRMTGRRRWPRPICATARHGRDAVGHDRSTTSPSRAASAPTIFPAARPAAAGLGDRRRRVLRRRRLSSRPACNAAGQSPRSARPMRDEIRTPEFGMGLDGLLNARAPSVVRHRQRHRHRCLEPGRPTRASRSTYSAKTLKDRAGQQARGAARTLRPRRRRRPAVLRHQPADLAEGHGPAAAGASTRLSRSAAGWPCSARATPALEGALARRRRAPSAARSASSSAMTKALSHLMQARLRRDPRPVAVRALRPDPALRRCAMAACRSSRRTGGLADTVIDANDAALSRRRRDRRAVRAGRRAHALYDAIAPHASRSTPTDSVWKAMQQQRHEIGCLVGAQRRALCRPLSNHLLKSQA